MIKKQQFPKKRHPTLSIAIPATFISDTPHLRDKTLKIGWIGRALAIFRVDQIIIFTSDPRKKKDANIMANILSYMETPQYLRKHLFKIRSELRYVGILPPLRTPHHPLEKKFRNLQEGELREGVIVKDKKRKISIDVGVDAYLPLVKEKSRFNQRATVRIVKEKDDLRADIIEANQVETYWGYKIKVIESPIGHLIKDMGFDLVIATSKKGEFFSHLVDKISYSWKNSADVLVAFGSPTHGLYEIFKQEGLKLADFADYIVNMIPNQATKTIRTEEAIYASLTLLNLL